MRNISTWSLGIKPSVEATRREGNHIFDGAKDDLRGWVPESWCCVDCGVNTAPGLLKRAETEKAIEAAKAAGTWQMDQGIPRTIDDQSEVYRVRDHLWKKAGMEPMGGCLCVGCFEKRLGRRLKPKDFVRDDAHNDPDIPGTARLVKRRKDRWANG
jgi:hypothetical protein